MCDLEIAGGGCWWLVSSWSLPTPWPAYRLQATWVGHLQPTPSQVSPIPLTPNLPISRHVSQRRDLGVQHPRLLVSKRAIVPLRGYGGLCGALGIALVDRLPQLHVSQQGSRCCPCSLHRSLRPRKAPSEDLQGSTAPQLKCKQGCCDTQGYPWGPCSGKVGPW